MDESKTNQGKRIKIDLLKVAHHGISYNNTNYFLTSLNPVTTIITGPKEWFDSRMKSDLPDTKVYSTMTDSAAVVVEFSFSGISTEYVKIKQEWEMLDGEYYYFDDNGRVITGWQQIVGVWYYFESHGAMQTGWKSIENIWYYFEGSGTMDHDMWIQSVYYLKASGAMAVSEWVDNDRYYVDEQGIWVPGI